ncbi:vacuolar ATP synthase subunit D [Terfezia claveryi]|nr:vacuolar ATP synthase subunit D [Terfezia claveryi]
MEGLFFNATDGYIEGIVRGYKNNLLTNANYSNLTQCETLEDLKLQLSPFYGDYLANYRSPGQVLNYITYAYMIDNVALLITGTLHERDTRELLDRCHPLGWFEAMPVLCVATNVEELYNSVLVETPLAPYFKDNLSSADLDDLNIEIIRNTLYKSYLEDFYEFCTTDPAMKGTSTAEIMSDILAFEADRRAINITLNSFGTELSKQDRPKLYPSFGKLYPEGTLMLSKADDIEGVRAAVEGVAEYKMFFEQGGFGPGGMMGGQQPKSLEDLFYHKEMEIAKMAFTQQFTYAIVFAWVKLREQEVRNITWIAECIAQNQKERIGNYISVF